MEANELRVGNWVDIEGQYAQVTDISDGPEIIYAHNGVFGDVFLDYPHTDYDNKYIPKATPIPLTEEWLKKFNREVIDDKCRIFINQDGLSLEIERMRLYKEPIWLSHSVGVAIKYVHQLQNLYFALTGEELQIKEQ